MHNDPLKLSENGKRKQVYDANFLPSIMNIEPPFAKRGLARFVMSYKIPLNPPVTERGDG